MDEWIELTPETMPPIDVDVLIYWVNHATNMAYYDVEFRGGPGWNSIINKPNLEIVAWMQLPKPPKVRERNG